ncbi:MAG: hypothetical protein ACP5QG_08760 [candidate division WOR-3 bacterium]
MKRFLAFGMLILTVSPAWAGKKSGAWDFGGSVGLTWIDNKPYPTVSAFAKYSISSYFIWTNEIKVTMRSSDSLDFTVPSTLEYHPFGGKQKIDPYLGPGITYTHSSGENMVGGTGVVGVDFLFVKGTRFGIKGTLTYYLIPEESYRWEIGPTGSWNWNF